MCEVCVEENQWLKVLTELREWEAVSMTADRTRDRDWTGIETGLGLLNKKYE